jgi:hypothetical protein
VSVICGRFPTALLYASPSPSPLLAIGTLPSTRPVGEPPANPSCLAGRSCHTGPPSVNLVAPEAADEPPRPHHHAAAVHGDCPRSATRRRYKWAGRGPYWPQGRASCAGLQAENGQCTIHHLIKFQIQFSDFNFRKFI